MAMLEWDMAKLHYAVAICTSWRCHLHPAASPDSPDNRQHLGPL